MGIDSENVYKEEMFQSSVSGSSLLLYLLILDIGELFIMHFPRGDSKLLQQFQIHRPIRLVLQLRLGILNRFDPYRMILSGGIASRWVQLVP